MDKYFVPKIEDMIEGYEFEYQEYDEDKDEFTENWIKTVFDSRGGLGHDLTHSFYEGRVRCEFLTRKQIEAEGWKYKNNTMGDLWFEKENHNLRYRNKKLYITRIFRDMKVRYSVVYDGFCPSINELKYITKLLRLQWKTEIL